MSATTTYQWLEPKPYKKFTKQLGIKGRNMIVWNLVAPIVVSGKTPEYVAQNDQLPLKAVEEAREELEQMPSHAWFIRAARARMPRPASASPAEPQPLMEPEAVARRALDSLGKRPSVVPGFINRLGDVFMTRLLSRRAAIRFMGKTTRRLYAR